MSDVRHDLGPVADPSAFCNALDEWAGLMHAAKRDRDKEDGIRFDRAWRDVRLMISKSCLLSRTIYGGEKPSRTPCPVHHGQWSGCHMPDQFKMPMDAFAAEVLGHPEWVGKSWHDLGCRCNQHKSCGCTTGWQPDEHCGCVVPVLGTCCGWLWLATTVRHPIEIEDLYQFVRQTPSDINEHVERLRQLGEECSHVTEFGVRYGVSTIAWISSRPKTLVCYDIERTADGGCLEQVARAAGVGFEYRIQDVLQASIEETDLLFIDTLHTYDQLRQELVLHAGKARKYIVMHDTETFGELWPAVTEFLAAHPEWALLEKRTNNNGLTVLTRRG